MQVRVGPRLSSKRPGKVRIPLGSEFLSDSADALGAYALDAGWGREVVQGVRVEETLLCAARIPALDRSPDFLLQARAQLDQQRFLALAGAVGIHGRLSELHRLGELLGAEHA